MTNFRPEELDTTPINDVAVAAMTPQFAAGFQALGQGDWAGFEERMGPAGLRAVAAISGQAPRSFTTMPTVVIREDDHTSAYDLFSLLLQQRIVMYQGGVDETMTAITNAALLYLASSAAPNHEDPIKMYIDSPGGSVYAGLSTVNIMGTLKCQVHGVGMGMQASMGSILMAACDKRYMTEDSVLMIHGASSGTEGKVTHQHNTLDATDRAIDRLYAVYIRHIGLNEDFWRLCDTEVYFNAQQAEKIHYIDGIIKSRGDVAPEKAVLAEGSARKFLFNQQARRDEQIPGTVGEIKDLLLGIGPNGHLAHRLRPEILVALAQEKQFQTPELQEKLAAAGRSSNDNDGGTSGAQPARGPFITH